MKLIKLRIEIQALTAKGRDQDRVIGAFQAFILNLKRIFRTLAIAVPLLKIRAFRAE